MPNGSCVNLSPTICMFGSSSSRLIRTTSSVLTASARPCCTASRQSLYLSASLTVACGWNSMMFAALVEFLSAQTCLPAVSWMHLIGLFLRHQNLLARLVVDVREVDLLH